MERFRLEAARLGYWVEFKDDGSVPGAYSMFASRILSVVQAPMTLYRSNDQVAGLMGVLYGYHLPSVFRYCRKMNPDELLEGRRRTEYVAALRDQIRLLARARPRRRTGRHREGRDSAGRIP